MIKTVVLISYGNSELAARVLRKTGMFEMNEFKIEPAVELSKRLKQVNFTFH